MLRVRPRRGRLSRSHGDSGPASFALDDPNVFERDFLGIGNVTVSVLSGSAFVYVGTGGQPSTHPPQVARAAEGVGAPSTLRLARFDDQVVRAMRRPGPMAVQRVQTRHVGGSSSGPSWRHAWAWAWTFMGAIPDCARPDDVDEVSRDVRAMGKQSIGNRSRIDFWRVGVIAASLPGLASLHGQDVNINPAPATSDFPSILFLKIRRASVIAPSQRQKLVPNGPCPPKSSAKQSIESQQPHHRRPRRQNG